MEDDADLNGLIGTFYDAVIDPGLWPAAIDRMRRHFQFQLCALTVISMPAGEAIVSASANIPAEYLADMGKYNDDVLALWGGPARIAGLPLEEPILTTEATNPADWVGNPFYENWCVPQGLVEQVVIVLAHDRTMIANLALGVHSTRPPLTEAEMQSLRLLAPHLRRAVTISRVVDIAASKAATFEAALEATGSGVVLVDADMAIMHSNGAAESMLQSGDPIRSVGGRLALRHELVPGQLEAAVSIASDEEGQLARRGIGIPTRLRDDSPLAVHVMPLSRRPLRGAARQRATAAVFVSDSGSPERPEEAMTLLYGLTPAEERVFDLVVAGKSTDEIAGTLAVAPSTLRTHLLHVFEKTGRRSRAELVKLSHEIVLPG